MFRIASSAGCAIMLCSCAGLAAQAAKPAAVSAVPTAAAYHIAFERRDAVPGASSSSVIALPFQCTSDGTIFINFVSPVPANVMPPPPPTFDLVSVSLSGVPHTFALAQITDLYNIRQTDHYAYDSGVAFLVKATRDSSLEQDTSKTAAEKAAARHYYVVTFDSDGRYKRTIQLGDELHIQRLAVFPSGTFLIYGYDPKDHTAKLVMLTDDGTYLKTLDAPGGAISVEPKSANDARKYPIMAAEFVRAGSSVMVLQQQGSLPILEVSEGGSARIFRPKFPDGGQAQELIPSDHNLFAVVEGSNKSDKGVIYELQPQDGSVQKLFLLDNPRDADSIACVHEGKFLSVDYGDGRITPWWEHRSPPADRPGLSFCCDLMCLRRRRSCAVYGFCNTRIRVHNPRRQTATALTISPQTLRLRARPSGRRLPARRRARPGTRSGRRLRSRCR